MSEAEFIRGEVEVVCRDGKQVLWRQRRYNLVVEQGLFLIAKLLAGTSTDTPHFIAMGDDNSGTTDDMTGLQGSQIGSREEGTATQNSNAFQLEAEFTISSETTIGEFGLFTASTGGTMFARFITSSFTAAAGNTVDVTWTLRVGEQ